MKKGKQSQISLFSNKYQYQRLLKTISFQDKAAIRKDTSKRKGGRIQESTEGCSTTRNLQGSTRETESFH